MEGGKGAEPPGPPYCPMTIVGAKWISGSCEGESGYHNIQAILGNSSIQRRYVRPRMHLLHHVQLVGAVSISPTVRSKTRLMTPVRGKGWQSCIQTPGHGSRIDFSSFCCVQASHLPWCGWSRLDTSGVSSLLRVGLSGMTGSGSLHQVVGSSELDFLTVE